METPTCLQKKASSKTKMILMMKSTMLSIPCWIKSTLILMTWRRRMTHLMVNYMNCWSPTGRRDWSSGPSSMDPLCTTRAPLHRDTSAAMSPVVPRSMTKTKISGGFPNSTFNH